MILVLLYWVSVSATCYLAWRSGGPDERRGAAILLIGSILSVIACSPLPRRFQGGEPGLLAVDLAVLLSFVTLALRSTRPWPIWVAGFHLVAVATHVAVLAQPLILPRAYALAQGFWAYPMMLALGWGCWRHEGASRV